MTLAPEPTTTIRLREPEDLLALIPHQTGHPPREASVVFLPATGGHAVCLGLDTPGEDRDVDVLAEELGDVLRTVPHCGEAVVVVYSDHEHGPQLTVTVPALERWTAVAQRLGLDPEVLVVSGMPDTHSAWAGAGRTGEGELHMAISTSSWISAAVSRKRTDVVHSIATMPGLLPGGYLIADNHEAAGASLAWVRDQGFGRSYEDLTALAAESPPGANGVVFTPWLAGMRSPRDDRSARAGWHNLSHRSTRADLVRAVLEGVAHQAAWLLEPVLRFTPTPSESIRIIGGGARSDLWCQIHADVLGRPIVRVEDPMTAQLRGVGLAAGVALGHLDWADLDALIPVDRTFEPEAARHTAYAQVTAELPRIHSGLKGTIGRLARS